MGTIKEKYGFLPTSVWHLDKNHKLNNFFKDKGDAHKKRRASGSFLPNYKFSSFNPNVAERVIKYWSEKGDLIFDPFAGRTTRGIVSLSLGRNYVGCEVSPTTFEDTLNNLQRMKMDDKFVLLNEDGCAYHEEIDDEEVDLVFTCPPYWKLERYEHCENQLSDCKTYDIFMNKIYDCLAECNRVLKEGKFSIWVVSDWRNAGYYCFHKDIINAHLDNGFELWDIVINVLNSPFVSFKAGFNDKYKYTGKTHEYILVFKKKALNNSIVPPSNSPTASSHSFGEHNMGLKVQKSKISSPKLSPTEITSPNPNIKFNKQK